MRSAAARSETKGLARQLQAVVGPARTNGVCGFVAKMELPANLVVSEAAHADSPGTMEPNTTPSSVLPQSEIPESI